VGELGHESSPGHLPIAHDALRDGGPIRVRRRCRKSLVIHGASTQRSASSACFIPGTSALEPHQSVCSLNYRRDGSVHCPLFMSRS
jgi:hypothetical protein